MNIEIKIKDGMKVEALVRGHKIKADQDKASGGEDSGPNPFEYFVASVGLCTAYYVRGFCKERKIDTDKIEINEKISDGSNGKVKFSINIKLPDDFPEKYHDALLKVASQCLVKRSIQNTPEFELKIV